ncbi:hypothetical protein SARC_04415 [Sphaeroforma arctica JP610]|uniref:Uncharacterized protein n=1 Tax=Sphaeroforma arctica JP610 TaxID=667725 RepID=A0A0L0G375_9EUKA|nr:hypothetical protein SARC_04415 [Sphaeroforma arctica JP610]KNC83319.1 hypothetical protein SARC_04415 [Sphaeroforma arctica JP610]|eukprot:XP_014157221.1 hypothetical protein SARC_04415 [Sphaeroforma arctica JP610]
MAACLAGKAEVVDFLLSKGADYTIGEKDGYFPHDGAGFQGRPAVTSVLLKHNISPDYVHRDGYPPIFRAAWGRTDNHAEVIRILIDEGGVSPTITDARGISLLDVASRTGIEKTVEVVQKAIASQKGSPKNEL